MHSLDLIMHSIFMLMLCFLLYFIMKKNKKNDPPGPLKLPLLGHLHLVGSLPHRSFYELSKKYGPIMLLKLGCVPTIIISSPTAAKEVLKDHDLACCSRPKLAASRRYSYDFVDLNLSPYGERWKELRKLCVSELFSASRVQSFQHVREEEVRLLLNLISQQSSIANNNPVNLTEESLSLVANIINKIAFGKRYRDSKLEQGNLHHVMRSARTALGSFAATDFFPKVGWMIDRITGIHAKLEQSFVGLNAFFQQVVDDRINSLNEENVIDVLIKIERERTKFDVMPLSTIDRIKALIMDIFLAGVDTPADTIVWTMAELIKNPIVMKKLQNEIRSNVKEDMVKESDLEKLPYLKLVVKESLRLHPAVPLLLPRESMSHFKVNGYNIDPKTRIHINVWAIGRDPSIWNNPEMFLPERFIESNIDYRGQHFELLPFGAGRRSCPGMNMGMIMVELTLANLLLAFDWKLPVGMRMEDFDMDEDPGLTGGKLSTLYLLPIPCT